MRSASCETSFGKPLILQGVKALGLIEGRMLDMTLVQRYRNPLRMDIEVVYTFPLPYQAVLLGLEVELNGQTMAAIVKSRDGARSDYEEALSEGNTGVLVNVNPDQSYTLELGNLMAEESCVIRIRYAQILQPAQGSLRMTLPLTLAPRYGDPVRAGRFEPHAVPVVDPLAEYPFDIEVKVRGELAHAQIASPSHQMATRHVPAGKPDESSMVDIRLAHDDWLDRDLVLIFSELRSANLGLAAQDRMEPGTAVVMASFTPKFPVHQPRPVVLKILVDCSGSMNGSSIEAARRALHGIMDQLAESDRFSLSRFGTTVEHRSKGMWKAAPPAKAASHRWIVNLEASMGGTEMEDAILSTLRIAGVRDGAGVLLITDGEVNNIDGVLDAARQSGHRFFVVGIGASPAEGLIRRLAEVTGGACEFVLPGEQVEAAILRMFHRLRSPSASNAQIHWPVECEVLMEINPPKCVFDGDDITVYAHLKVDRLEALQGNVQLTATLADGQPLELGMLSASLIEDEGNTLARLAMAKQDRQQRQRRQERQATKDKPDKPSLEANGPLIALAEKYQLVTPDTSLILIQQRASGERAEDMPELVQVRSMLAAGWGGHGTPITPEPSSLKSVSFSIAYPDMALPSVYRTVDKSKRHPTFAQLSVKPLSFDALREHLVRNNALIESRRKSVPGHWTAPKLNDDFWCLSGEKGSSPDPSQGGYQGLTPAGLVEGLRINPKELWPISCKELDAICIGAQILDWLELVVGHDQDEQLVVETFIEVMTLCRFTSRQTISGMVGTLSNQSSTPENPEQESLRRQILQGLVGLSARQWPAAMLKQLEFEQFDE